MAKTIKAIDLISSRKLMIHLRRSLALLALLCPTQAWAVTAHDFFPICAAPSGNGGQTLIVDPSGGQKGSYPSIATAQRAARPGDKIDLMTADYGAVVISGTNQNDFITIEAAPGQTPRFNKLMIGSGNGETSRWRLSGLTISGFSTGRSADGAVAHYGLVNIVSSDNIVLDHNYIQSQAGEFSWQSELTNPNAPAVSNGIGADWSSCISIVENHISNVFNGMIVGGDQIDNHGKYFLVMGNTIDNFAGDGIDHSASHIRIVHNRITNAHDICENKCIHTDGIQGWNWHDKAGLLNTDVVIDSNIIIAQTRPGLAWPADDLHGITIFDGRWEGMQIVNNLIVTVTWHGITAYSVNNLSIMNNTVVGINPTRRTWIAYIPDKDDPPDLDHHVIVRNNVALDLPGGRGGLGRGVTVDHNFRVSDSDEFADNFVKFDPEHFIFDLHPTKRSDATGEGSAEGAPAIDIEGKPRQGKIDIGAYAFAAN
jgi:hypothetical protein